MGPFEDGELMQDNQTGGLESTESNESEDNNLNDGEEASGAEENDEDQGGQGEEEGQNLLAGKYKTFGGLAQAYVDQRRRLGLPVDLQNYANDKALEKAFLRDKARIGGNQGEAQNGNDNDLDSMSAEDLTTLLQTQQTQIMQSLGMVGPPGQGQFQQQPPMNQQFNGQIPGQFNQSMNQGNMNQGYGQQPQIQIPQMKPHSLDSWKGDPEQWFQEVLLTKGPAALLDIIREEIDRQGQVLGYGIANLIGPIGQQVQEVRSQVEYDREAKNLNRKLKSQGDSLDNYEDEMAVVYKQYPALAQIQGGMEKALELAKTMKTINAKKTASKKTNVAAARIPSGSSGVPRVQNQRTMSPEDQLYNDIVKKRR